MQNEAKKTRKLCPLNESYTIMIEPKSGQESSWGRRSGFVARAQHPYNDSLVGAENETVKGAVRDTETAFSSLCMQHGCYSNGCKLKG